LPIAGPGRPKPSRPAPGAELRAIVGREKLREGGVTAALAPPITALRLGRAFSEWTGVILLIWFGDTRSSLRATCCPLTRVLRETAVNPFGARMFA
jgi:hypothetical protein